MINVTAIPGNYLILLSGSTPPVSNLNWGGPVKPLAAITVFGKQVDKFQIGKYGQLKFLTYPDGQFKYSDVDHDLPGDMDELWEGYQVIGFGQPFAIKGCAARVLHGLSGSNYVINFRVIDKYSNVAQRWQYVFPLAQKNKIIVNYLSVVTSYDTVVGACGAPDDADQWVPLQNHAYKYVAILIDTNASADKEDKPPAVYGPIDEPDEPPVVITDTDDTEVIWIDGPEFEFEVEGDLNFYRIQRRAK